MLGHRAPGATAIQRALPWYRFTGERKQEPGKPAPWQAGHGALEPARCCPPGRRAVIHVIDAKRVAKLRLPRACRVSHEAEDAVEVHGVKLTFLGNSLEREVEVPRKQREVTCAIGEQIRQAFDPVRPLPPMRVQHVRPAILQTFRV